MNTLSDAFAYLETLSYGLDVYVSRDRSRQRSKWQCFINNPNAVPGEIATGNDPLANTGFLCGEGNTALESIQDARKKYEARHGKSK